jgi:hypothetical protein
VGTGTATTPVRHSDSRLGRATSSSRSARLVSSALSPTSRPRTRPAWWPVSRTRRSLPARLHPQRDPGPRLRTFAAGRLLGRVRRPRAVGAGGAGGLVLPYFASERLPTCRDQRLVGLSRRAHRDAGQAAVEACCAARGQSRHGLETSRCRSSKVMLVGGGARSRRCGLAPTVFSVPVDLPGLPSTSPWAPPGRRRGCCPVPTRRRRGSRPARRIEAPEVRSTAAGAARDDLIATLAPMTPPAFLTMTPTFPVIEGSVA